MKKVLFAAASLLAFAVAGAAHSADLGRPLYKTPLPAPLPPVQDWSGIYVGIEGGYGWGQQSTDAISPGDQFSPVFTPVAPPGPGEFVIPPQLLATLFFPGVTVPSIKQNGWLFGGFLGAQKQFGNWVFGFESDIDGANIKGSGTASASSISPGNSAVFAVTGGGIAIGCGEVPCFTLNHNVSIDSKIDALASIRGKVGWSFAPDWLIYGTGGAAFAHVENTVISTQSSVAAPLLTAVALPCGVPAPLFCTLSPTNIVQNTSGRGAMFGWAAGGGVDWKLQLDAGSALVFGVEYLHYGFPEQTIGLTDSAGGSFRLQS